MRAVPRMDLNHVLSSTLGGCDRQQSPDLIPGRLLEMKWSC